MWLFNKSYIDLQRSKESQAKADRAARLVAQVKNGIEHLSAKLHHIKLVSPSTLNFPVVSLFQQGNPSPPLSSHKHTC